MSMTKQCLSVGRKRERERRHLGHNCKANGLVIRSVHFSNMHCNQARKGNPNPDFLVRISSGGVGFFHVGGGQGQKARYVPRNQGNQTFLAGYPGILAGYPGGARKVWPNKKKVCVQFLVCEAADLLAAPKPRKIKSSSKVTKKWLSGSPPK